MRANCPKCDKTLESTEIGVHRCSCGMEFKITKDTDFSVMQEDYILSKLAQEALGEKKSPKRDFYAKIIEMFKGHLGSVVCLRKKKYCYFYLLKDGEIVAFLFRLRNYKSFIHLEFDTRLGKHAGVNSYSKEEMQKAHNWIYKSYMRTRDIEQAVRMAIHVYELKKRRFSKYNPDKKIKMQTAGVVG